MKSLVGLGVALLFAGGLCAQRAGTGVFGNVVFPGGTAATVPGLQRTSGNFISPLYSGSRKLAVGSSRRTVAAPVIYSYPLVGGGYGYGYAPDGSVPVDQPAQQQGNITVIYPPQPAPVIINQFGASGDSGATAHPRMYDVQPEQQPEDTGASTAETAHYLLAFKDHTILSATNYWVDGDTLHYFTAGNTHNQASLSLIDRDLTLRLNQESGVDVKLPAVK